MDLFDWLFPEQSQAIQLRRLANLQARSRVSVNIQSNEVEELERETRELRLYLTAITQLLVEKGLIRADELQSKLITMLPPLPPPSPAENDPFAGLKLDT